MLIIDTYPVPESTPGLSQLIEKEISIFLSFKAFADLDAIRKLVPSGNQLQV
jgi:hypothetical protein